MYSETSISLLSNRIKWRAPLEAEYANILENDIKASDTDKAFQDVHKTVTIHNIHGTQPDSDISNADFNVYLRRMMRICANKVLEDVFSLNKRAVVSVDYDSMINDNIEVFDEPLKLYMAIQTIQLIISTTRSNLDERILKLSYNKLKVELEGAKNENGKIVSVGLFYLYSKSINNVIDILFPKEDKVIIQSLNAW